MNDAEMRAVVMEMYPGPRWRARVRLMRPEQIYMIYNSKRVMDEAEAEHASEPEQLKFDI